MIKVLSNHLRNLGTLLFIVLLSACASSPEPSSDVEVTNAFKSKMVKSRTEQKSSANTIHHSSDNHSVNNSEGMQPDDFLYLLLMNEYHYWKGSPYRLGGNSLKGIDCSSLVQTVFKSTLNLSFPRTTRYQSKKGYSIKKGALQVGDLVFFKTGKTTRHVGIYMGENEFFHVSTSKGVKISSLDNPYWKRHYWQSRRVIH